MKLEQVRAIATRIGDVDDDQEEEEEEEEEEGEVCLVKEEVGRC